MTAILPVNRCRMCGASSDRPVIDRDGTGAMRATGRYRCSGCSVVFADPRAWREGGEAAPASASAPPAPTLVAGGLAHGSAQPPPGIDWQTCGAVPVGRRPLQPRGDGPP